MSVSRETVRAILTVVSKYVADPARVDALLIELESVKGNSSFRATIEALRREYEAQKE